MPDKSTALCVFSPSGKRGRFPVGTRVLQAARELGVDIDSICGGRARCGRCQVEAVEGSFAKEQIVSSPRHLTEMGEAEQYCLQRGRLDDGNRLSCQAKILGDVRIDVPASSQVHHQVVRKDYEAHDIKLDPVVHLYFVEVGQADMHTPEGDLQRLMRALKEEWGLTGLSCDLVMLQQLQDALREGKWQVTVAIRYGNQIVAVWPGFRDQVFGAAIDVGSTTIAVHLCDLISGEVRASSGAMNPQIRFGEDLMSRVSYAMLNPEGAGQMTTAVRQSISRLIADTAGQAGIGIEDILEITLVGNPVMHHLLLGLDPTPLGVAPFALATDRSVDIWASEIDIELHPNARAYLLPCIAGHVGADTAAVMLAETPWESEKISLVIDVGTNAEIVLGNSDRLLAASSPTGPAFEGAQISGGQRAAPGAIERVRIDPETLEPRFRVIGCELWSDQPGFDEAIGEQGVTGICGSGIIEVVAGMYLTGIIRADGSVSGDARSRSNRIQASGRTFSYLLHDGEPRIVIEQGDIRAIQLAKAALYAGARLLMDRMGVDRVDRIRLAGAFGSHIDVKYAMVLGMIPDCDLGQVSSANNAAGTGARIALLNRASRIEIEQRARTIEKIETAVDAGFQQHFVDAMGIPHTTQAYPELSRVMDLPQSPQATSDAVPGRRHRRRRRRG
ncbi:MAG: ASKHA domain-containing protein [Xanthomonadales bacterium]|nr:ASKHA domain-containing protein [Xanthomonadales bacterium]MDH3940436.1 ASKHA domain-containing protein [Xanthomonadales bacterium]MDH4001518.1 ASKHA domain-containing protein [Xanthomonadales bacterium]